MVLMVGTPALVTLMKLAACCLGAAARSRHNGPGLEPSQPPFDLGAVGLIVKPVLTVLVPRPVNVMALVRAGLLPLITSVVPPDLTGAAAMTSTRWHGDRKRGRNDPTARRGGIGDGDGGVTARRSHGTGHFCLPA
jgi:hypothetical protein